MKLPGSDILHWRNMASYLELLQQTEDVPIVRAVSEFVFHKGFNRNVAPATVSKLISRLPNLRHLTAGLSDNERENEALRNSLRHDFAMSIPQWPASLKHLALVYPREAPRDADFPPLKRSKPGADALCIALRKLSTQLETIYLEDMMFGPELFWPQNDDDTEQPSWPHLTSFDMVYAAATPSGQWLFERDPRCPEYSFDRDPEHLYMRPPMDDAPQDEFPDDYRTAPSPALNAMYTAAAHAAQHMPNLETVDLTGQVQTSVGVSQQGMHGLLRHRIIQCDTRHRFHYERGQGLVSWVGTWEFPLKPETRTAWEETAKVHGHPELIVENVVEEKVFLA